ncbi:MAG TPA: hypothetical protein VE988_30605 [Gemmataceae bacterium]|nr:hypothetical protein [Gemmataceae bacterium]
MTEPFTYPDTTHRRRHGPRGYADYESYRPWLRDEFAFRCVYCLTREAWGPLTGWYAIDHFAALALRPDLAREYDNLLYACAACNLSKSHFQTPDPTAALLASTVRVTDDGVLHADSPEAAQVIEVLGLNREKLIDYRELWIGIIRVAAAADPALYRRLMGFPDELPDLKRLRPPGGNTRPEGVSASHFALRQGGTLPATY